MADLNQDIIMYAKKKFGNLMANGKLSTKHFIKYYKIDKGVTLTKKQILHAFEAYGQQRYIKEAKINEELDSKDEEAIRLLIRKEIASVFFDLFKKRSVWEK